MKWRLASWKARRDVHEEARFVEEVGRAIGSVVTFEELRQVITRRFREIAGCDLAIFCRYSRDSHSYTAEMMPAMGPAAVALQISSDGPMVRWLRTNEECLIIGDDRHIVDFLGVDERRLVDHHSVRACVPLISDGRLVALVLLTATDELWSLDDAVGKTLCACGRRAAAACEATDLQAAERQRLSTMHRAQQLAVAGQLAAAVAHEVRNPLAAIRSTIQYVLGATGDWETKRPLLEQLIKEVDRIEHTVSGILTLSRPRDLEVAEVDLAEVADDAIKLVRLHPDSQKVTVEATLEQPLRVMGDARELKQVFVNLLLNACQAMPGDGVIQVSSAIAVPPRADDEPKRFGVIRIADNGPGIPRELLSKILDPFFTTKAGGTGLGLPICLEIVNRHGGVLDLSLGETSGLIASVFIPLRAL